MPELPEVETTVYGLNKKVVGREIIKVWSDWEKTVKKPADFSLFKKEILGEKILEARRKGKNILIDLSGGKIILIHQKMTGHLLVSEWKIKKSKSAGKKIKYEVIPLKRGALKEKVNGYIHLILFLDNGKQLALSDLRKFAKVMAGKKEEIEGLKDLSELGPDPLDKNLTFAKFREILKKQKRKIKMVLMDQSLISGIGNIYSDEILWEAKINPKRRADGLSAEQLKKIFFAAKRILKKSIKLGGDSMSDFRGIDGKKGGYQNEHKVYRRTGQRCFRCGALIKKIKFGDRSCHFCPKCQK